MFRALRTKRRPANKVPGSAPIPTGHLDRDPTIPISFKQLNSLPENTKERIYRALLPPELMRNYNIDPITWKSPDSSQPVRLIANPDTSSVEIILHSDKIHPDNLFTLQLSDNYSNRVELGFMQVNDPDSPRYDIEFDEAGKPTLLGTARRNLVEEKKAMLGGLTPGQTHRGLRSSEIVIEHLETFLVTLGHREYFLEPLTYASAWLFERRGFAYLRGQKLMNEVHVEFQPGGRLHSALDGSTLFRKPDQWQTVRGRAWAIHDGILDSIDARWDGLRMVKQIGKCAGVNTFPDAMY